MIECHVSCGGVKLPDMKYVNVQKGQVAPYYCSELLLYGFD